MKMQRNTWLLVLALGIFLPGCATNRTRTTETSSVDREQTVAEIPAHGGRKIPVTESR
jgi:hypothetical protein